MIPYGCQQILPEDEEAVLKVLRGPWLTQGPAIREFEESIEQTTDAPYAIAVSSATAGLHLACVALGLEEGSRLWTVPNTYVASANCGLYCGATVDFVDIRSDTLILDCDKLEDKLIAADATGTLPDVVVPVHFSGHSCDMERIGHLAKRFGFRVIEDAAHAIGSHYNGSPVGACPHSDMAVFSFHPVKIVTSAEGGVITTRDTELAERLNFLRTHGVTRDPKRWVGGAPDGPWDYQLIELGYNYRITDLQAALGASQMKRIESYIARRNELIELYFDRLKNLPLELQARPAHGRSAYHLAAVRVDEREAGLSRRELFDRLREAGLGVNVHYIPVHTQPVYRELGFKEGDFPVAEAYYRQAISLPLFGHMTDEQFEQVIAAIETSLALPAAR